MSRAAVAVVVIGRNEGERLARCLRAVRAIRLTGPAPEVVYVDSASTDGSLITAKTLGARAAVLDTPQPSAAAARRLGMSMTTAPFVLFLDGDTEVHPEFLLRSLPRMRDRRVAAVWGRLWELQPQASPYIRVHELEWNAIPGPTASCGGNALYRRAALEDAGSFSSAMFAGEEAELCRRLRLRGWSILHTEDPMAGHDLALLTFSQYWRRCLRTGYSYARLAALTEGDAETLGAGEIRHNLAVAAKTALLFTGSIAAAVVARSPWPLAAIPAALSLVTALSAWRHRRQASGRTLAEYAVHAHLAQAPIFVGQMLYRIDRLRGRDRGIIEYKQEPAAGKSAKVGAAMASSLAAQSGYFVSRILLPPLVLAKIGLHEYGVWSLCLATVGYLSVVGLGVQNSVVRGAARRRAQGRDQEVGRLVSAALGIMWIASAVFGAAAWIFAPYWTASLGLTGAEARDAGHAFVLTAVVFLACEQTLGVLGSALEGCQRQTTKNLVWVAAAWLETILIVLFLNAGMGLLGLAAAFAARMICGALSYAVLISRLGIGSCLRPRLPGREEMREFVNFGGVIQANGLLSTILFSIEKMLAGAFVGPAAAGIFEIGEKLPITMAQVSGGLNAVLMPAMAHEIERGEERLTRDLYLKGTRRVAVVSGALAAFLCVFASDILRVWVKSAPAETAIVMALFSVAFHLHVCTGAGSAMHRAAGRPIRESFYAVVQAALVIVFVPLALLFIGRTVTGVAAAVSAAMALSALSYMAYNNKCFGVANGRFWEHSLLPGLAPYIAAFGVLLAARAIGAEDATRLAGLMRLGSCAAAYGLLLIGGAALAADQGERSAFTRLIKAGGFS